MAGVQAPTALPAVGRESTESLLSTADELLQQMSQMTGLPVKASVRKQIVSRKEIQKYLVDKLHTDYTPQELHAQEAVVKAFGLASKDFSLEEFLIRFYTEQAAGFYDPRRKTMFIADWIAPELQTTVLAHELTHALQDQSFDLDKFLRPVRDDDDASGARLALAEGYATAAMIQHLVGPLQVDKTFSLEPIIDQLIRREMAEFPAFSSAPFFFRFQAIFPYLQGTSFVRYALGLGGWESLMTLFQNPPATSKEIFDPPMYFRRLPLPKIGLPRPASLIGVSGTKFLTENVMGQIGYYALLGQLISEDEAKALAPAWLGDRYVLYEGPEPEHYGLVARVRWSGPEPASTFFHDYLKILARKYGELKTEASPLPPSPDREIFVGATGSERVVIVRRRDECLWAEGIPLSRARAMLDYLLSLSP